MIIASTTCYYLPILCVTYYNNSTKSNNKNSYFTQFTLHSSREATKQ